jgi:hypothetical protein
LVSRRTIQLARARRLEPFEQVVVGDDADGAWRVHGRSVSITVCSSSFASPICSITKAMSSVGRPGVRAFWQ